MRLQKIKNKIIAARKGCVTSTADVFYKTGCQKLDVFRKFLVICVFVTRDILERIVNMKYRKTSSDVLRNFLVICSGA